MLGKYSYSIYVCHYPVFFLCAFLFHNVAVYLLVSLPCIAIIAYSLQNWLQPAVVNFFKKSKSSSLEVSEWVGVGKFAKLS
jgi:peptidoglycan/LPS O-acetylase OafA/YrhL